MDHYIQLISAALQERKWEKVIELATEAKNKEAGDIFIGIRKGYANILYGYNPILEKNFQEIGIVTIIAHSQPDLNKHIREGRLSKELVDKECVVIFTTKPTVVNKLISQNYPISYFSVTTRQTGVKGTEKYHYYGPNNQYKTKRFDKYEDICHIKNKATSESIKFVLDKTNTKALSSYLRDKRINDIFDDGL